MAAGVMVQRKFKKRVKVVKHDLFEFFRPHPCIVELEGLLAKKLYLVFAFFAFSFLR